MPYLVMVVVENKAQAIAQVETLEESIKVMDTQTRLMPTFSVAVPSPDLRDRLYIPEETTEDQGSDEKLDSAMDEYRRRMK